MFVHAIPDNKNGKDGYYCSLVESARINGVPKHKIIISFGFVPSDRLPFLQAAFNAGNPDEILRVSKEKLAKRKVGKSNG